MVVASSLSRRTAHHNLALTPPVTSFWDVNLQQGKAKADVVVAVAAFIA